MLNMFSLRHELWNALEITGRKEGRRCRRFSFEPPASILSIKVIHYDLNINRLTSDKFETFALLFVAGLQIQKSTTEGRLKLCVAWFYFTISGEMERNLCLPCRGPVCLQMGSTEGPVEAVNRVRNGLLPSGCVAVWRARLTFDPSFTSSCALKKLVRA